ncbi:DDE-type integrase/transposase/recombinase [Streptomyces sp. NPDC056061]|uniref:DDE-type integrase/transposase/recombinase n=1 Tax=Streptomyces sp. NPDC056061 TaxID=3345700 RepID=UPI0035D94609
MTDDNAGGGVAGRREPAPYCSPGRYLPTAEGWLHLACRLGLATREVVGCAMADHHRAGLVVDALDMAHGRGGPESGCVIHSDRGSEYTSTWFREK